MTEYTKRLGTVAATCWAVAILLALLSSALPWGGMALFFRLASGGFVFVATIASYCFAAEWTDEVNPNKDKERRRY